MAGWLEARGIAPWLFASVAARAFLAALTALGLALLLGRPLIRRLASCGMRQTTRKMDSERLDHLHAAKDRTPTAGGFLIVGATIAASLAWTRLDRPQVGVALLALLLFGAIGFIDDVRKLRGRRGKGLTARGKLALQTIAGLIVAAAALWALRGRAMGRETDLVVPFGASLAFPLGAGALAWGAFVLVGSVNAVNLTDGLDGLAAGCVVLASVAIGVLSAAAGHAGFSGYLGLASVDGAGEGAVVAGALAGATLGFLYFNCHPAEVFMGDTGALGIGGILAAVALLAKLELALVLIGGIFVVEAVSVLLQIGSFRLFKRRIFRIAPLHHHFEFGGWSERQVTTRFWVAAAVLALAALLVLRAR
ncbi:MAG: phospho-N-acetylmuramoyl-pentapeptide-transferase [Planctomycetes bacterium]|nr:phospho-N-acetylmuramoyl-pentapeptide-transferase [Planctomycetota bacterium]